MGMHTVSGIAGVLSGLKHLLNTLYEQPVLFTVICKENNGIFLRCLTYTVRQTLFIMSILSVSVVETALQYSQLVWVSLPCRADACVWW